MTPRQIQLPRTPTRPRAISHIKLLYYLSPNPSTGFDFKGETYKPGMWIEEKDLWPTPDYPIIPVALEHTEALYTEKPHGKGNRRIPTVSVVWTFTDGEWREVARYTGHALDWVHHIAAVVRQLLDQHAPERPPADPSPAVRRIITVVQRELHALSRTEDRCELLQCVYEFFAGELAHQKSGSQMPLDWDRHFEGR